MTASQAREERVVAERYLNAAILEYSNHPTKDLIGRALSDHVDRMQRILDFVNAGVPFGKGRNR